MTEPQGGSDPDAFTTRAAQRRRRVGHRGLRSSSPPTPARRLPHRDGRDRPRRERLPGHVDVPRPDRHPRRRDRAQRRPGGRDRGHEGMHALIRYEEVRVPADSLLGGEGQAFAIAQTRLGGGRIHHAMRTVGMASKALDMMCERALSRATQGELLADKQSVQNYIADSYAQLTQFRLFVLLRRLGDRPVPRLPQGARTTSPPSRCSPRRCCTTSSSGPSRSTGRWGCPTRCRWAGCG